MRNVEATVHETMNATLTLERDGFRVYPHHAASCTFFSAADAVDLAQEILRRYDVKAVA